uniref:Uncharacterized protein n=1 Tax=Anopheles atroparvus TaxID=41427 RepID=A0AAG5CYJ3_ANOAO
MNWQGGEEYGAFSCPVYGPTPILGAMEEMPQIEPAHEHQQQPQQQHHLAWNGVDAASIEIPLLNDDQEKAILSDLCDQTVGESTPLSTFSYISEYICSNNIDIWPGETVGSGCGVPSSATMGSSGDPKAYDQQSSTLSSCVHQQLFLRCKRVLESIIARNEQILELLRQKQHQQAACRPSRQ